MGNSKTGRVLAQARLFRLDESVSLAQARPCVVPGGTLELSVAYTCNGSQTFQSMDTWGYHPTAHRAGHSRLSETQTMGNSKTGRVLAQARLFRLDESVSLAQARPCVVPGDTLPGGHAHPLGDAGRIGSILRFSVIWSDFDWMEIKVIKCLGLNNWGFDVVSVLMIEMLGKVPKECVEILVIYQKADAPPGGTGLAARRQRSVGVYTWLQGGLKYGVIRIWIWDNHECDSVVEAMVTLRNRHWEHFGIMHQRMGAWRRSSTRQAIARGQWGSSAGGAWRKERSRQAVAAKTVNHWSTSAWRWGLPRRAVTAGFEGFEAFGAWRVFYKTSGGALKVRLLEFLELWLGTYLLSCGSG
ncbi:hypothetical protein DEO72_LG2g2173 [Vigna unguiculata]|uniref:Uncharacterized protein n=1 Tax=Vigna unguiculata TaxID=3917 RepID=A0A4D6KYI2_VIGUN|nr:hypothetical protein DEO72_LG2g2173 [Vigna unguiculata]